MKVKKHGICFDSRFELRVWEMKIPNWEYHKLTIPYRIEWKTDKKSTTTNHTYSPDFTERRDGLPTVLYELKGTFHDREAVRKTQRLIEILVPEYDFCFVFEKDTAPLTRTTAKRKDGSRFSLKEWCAKYDYKYITEQQLRMRK